MAVLCCQPLLGILHIFCGSVIICTNILSKRFHFIIFWLSLSFVVLGCFCIYNICNRSLFMKVFISVFSINCSLIAGYIIIHTIKAWNIDIWDLDAYKHWDYLTAQHLYMETQICSAITEILLDISSSCVSYAASKQNKEIFLWK